jgi:hypothetical protein
VGVIGKLFLQDANQLIKNHGLVPKHHIRAGCARVCIQEGGDGAGANTVPRTCCHYTTSLRGREALGALGTTTTATIHCRRRRRRCIHHNARSVFGSVTGR